MHTFASRQVESVDDVLKVATVATSNDVEMAKVIAKAFERVNLDAKVGGAAGHAVEKHGLTSLLPLFTRQLGGATLLEDGNAAEDILDVSNGMRLDRSGFDSRYFVTDPDRLVSRTCLTVDRCV